MTGPTDFAKFVPGFDFLQGLMKNAGQAIPGMGQWIAPTLDPEEIDKRIEQLRTVQFWLEQNARLLSATIQALEVQRMTLSTLKNMNMPMERMRDAFKIVTPDAAAPGDEARAADGGGRGDDDSRSAAPADEPPPAPRARGRSRGASASAAPAAPAVDPMQWWNALTQQFTELAASALKDSGAEAARNFAGQALKAAADLPARAMDAGAQSMRQAADSAMGRMAGRAPAEPAAAPAPAARKSAAKPVRKTARTAPRTTASRTTGKPATRKAR